MSVMRRYRVPLTAIASVLTCLAVVGGVFAITSSYIHTSHNIHEIQQLTIQLARVQAAQQEESKNQLTNRVANVATWCDAINNDRDINREIVERAGIKYHLKDLNCAALEAATAVSKNP